MAWYLKALGLQSIQQSPRRSSMLKAIVLLVTIGATFGVFAADFAADPAQACATLTKTSMNEGVRLLIIGIEGTNEFDKNDANSLYTYAAAEKSGQVAAALPKMRPSSGALSDGLLFPLLQELGSQVDVVSFDFNNPFNNGFALASTCALEWTRDPRHMVMIVGHSTGAQQAIQLAEILYNNQIHVNTLVTIDAIPLMNIFTGLGEFSRPPGVSHYLNFYQSVDPNFIYRGQSASNANVNDKVSDVQGHFTMTTSKTIYKALSAQISLLLGEVKTASLAN
jgi:hypothetical protein